MERQHTKHCAAKRAERQARKATPFPPSTTFICPVCNWTVRPGSDLSVTSKLTNRGRWSSLCACVRVCVCTVFFVCLFLYFFFNKTRCIQYFPFLVAKFPTAIGNLMEFNFSGTNVLMHSSMAILTYLKSHVRGTH